jgi:transglutaminase-like putative cysteine protease
MRIQIQHETVYRYAVPAKYVIQKLRLTPRSHDGQHVRRWRIEVSGDCRLTERDDAFGNRVHTFTVTGASTNSPSGRPARSRPRIPRVSSPALPNGCHWPSYLRETELTAPDEAMRVFAERFAAGRG